MAGLATATLIGYLGADPEMRFTPNGDPVTTFSLAVNSSKDKDEEPQWFSVVCWGRLAEACSQYLKKGSRCYVEGRLKLATWEGRDGQQRSRIEVTASQVLFLSSPRAAAGVGAGEDDEATPPFE